jgi:hypothetical protein
MENRQQTFPAMPPSFSAGGHEMRDYYADSSAPRPSPNQNPYLTPYLGLRARLSQVWINRWTVLLLLVLVRVLLAIDNSGDLIDDAQVQALAACSVVEKTGSTMASIPYYASQGFNKMTAHGIEKAVSGLQTMVTMTLTGVEEIVVFYIGMLTNTYLCLITLAVSGSLHAAVDVLANAQKAVTDGLTGIENDIGSAATGLQNGINSLVSGINTVFGQNAPPKVDFSGPIGKLKNFTLPAGLTNDLKKLNSSIPTFDDVKNVTDDVIRLPFEELKKVISNSWGNYTFNDSLLPVPQKETLTFCNDNVHINSFFDDMRGIAHTAKKIFIAVLLTLAIAACVPMALMEMRRFRKLQMRSKLVDAHATDKMDKAYLLSRLYTSDFGKWAASKVSGTRRQILVRWCVAYMTSIPALLLLSLALAGFFSCLCQLIFVRALEKEVPALAAEVAGFAGDIVNKLNNASAAWATDTNAVILQENAKLNQDLLGWVNISTEAVNATLNKFVDETIHVLNLTFGGTPLFDPIKEVFNCLIGLKVAGIENGLTWVHDNAHLDFPLLSNDTLTGGAILSKAGPEEKQFFDDPSSITQNDVATAVTKVGDKIMKGIRQEALISTMILVAWLIVFLSGLIYTLVKLSQHHELRGNGGNEYGATSAPQTDVAAYAAPLEPAPAYSAAHQDVNANAPYALNPHPLPQTINDDEYTTEKTSYSHTLSDGWSSQSYNTNQRQYNEKSGGFI